ESWLGRINSQNRAQYHPGNALPCPGLEVRSQTQCVCLRPLMILSPHSALRTPRSALESHASARVTARVAPQKTPANIGSARVHGSRGVRATSVPILILILILIKVRSFLLAHFRSFCPLLRAFAPDILPASDQI